LDFFTPEGITVNKFKFKFKLCRSQQEVESGMSLADARSAEQDFFVSDPKVQGLERQYWGMDTVIERLVEIQSQKVGETFSSD
jgi:hypothetical protein